MGTISGTSFNRSESGDQILVYTGSASLPVFIAAINFNGTGWDADAPNPDSSAIPRGLTNNSTE